MSYINRVFVFMAAFLVFNNSSYAQEKKNVVSIEALEKECRLLSKLVGKDIAHIGDAKVTDFGWRLSLALQRAHSKEVKKKIFSLAWRLRRSLWSHFLPNARPKIAGFKSVAVAFFFMGPEGFFLKESASQIERLGLEGSDQVFLTLLFFESLFFGREARTFFSELMQARLAGLSSEGKRLFLIKARDFLTSAVAFGRLREARCVLAAPNTLGIDKKVKQDALKLVKERSNWSDCLTLTFYFLGADNKTNAKHFWLKQQALV